MSVQPIDFPSLLRLWPASEKNTAYAELAEDMGVTPNQARQWLNRNQLPTSYWPRFQDVLRKKFGKIITDDRLAQAFAEHAKDLSARARRSAETRKRNRAATAADCSNPEEPKTQNAQEVNHGSDSPRL
jgi:DNA-directed RNA polymerase sigma subunit (sigma70/sigma32)